MCCYHPLTILDGRTGVSRSVPCGKCIGCLQDYQNSWKIRITDELKHYGYKGVYFTLTYDPKFAVDTGNIDEFCKFSPFDIRHDRNRVLTVWKPHVQGWIKRCRRRMEYRTGKRPDFKYFITSEYGPNTLRPHYHGIFIGLDVKDFNEYFLEDWSLPFVKKYYKKFIPGRIRVSQSRCFDYVPNKFMRGSVDYEEIVFDNNKSPESCSDYVSKYCSKGFFENPRVHRGDVEKTFHLVSKRLGLCKISELNKEILRDYQECSTIVNKEDFSVCRDFYNGKDFSKDYYYGLLSNYNPMIHEKEPSYFSTGVMHSYNDDGSVKESWYDTVFCLAPRLDYMRELVSRMFIVRYDKNKDKTFKYKLPRYYYDKLFPKNTAIRKAVQDVLQILSDEALSRKLEQLQTEWPSETASQIYHRYLLQEKYKKDRAESEAILYVGRRYNKSIL